MNYGKRIAAVSGAAALTLAVAACGSDDEFCDELDGFISEYSGKEQALTEDPELVDSMVADLRGVAEAAPDEVRANWDTYVDAFEAASVMFAPSADENADDEPVDAASAIAELEEASVPVNEHAAEECEVQLG